MVFRGVHVVYLMAFSYYVHGEFTTYLEATLQCLVIVFTMLTIYPQMLPYGVWLSSVHGVYCLLEGCFLLFNYRVHGAYFPFMEATLLCSVVAMVCFKPNVYGVNYPFIFCFFIIQLLFITSIIM
jgi:hypothetical protein